MVSGLVLARAQMGVYHDEEKEPRSCVCGVSFRWPRVVVCGNEPSMPYRCYAPDLVGGLPKPLTPEGFVAGPVSPDGRRVVAIAPDRTWQIVSLEDSNARPAPGVTPHVPPTWRHLRGLVSGEEDRRDQRLDARASGGYAQSGQ